MIAVIEMFGHGDWPSINLAGNPEMQSDGAAMRWLGLSALGANGELAIERYPVEI